MSKTRKRDNQPRATVAQIAARFVKPHQQAAVKEWDGHTLTVAIGGQLYRCENLERIPDPPPNPTKSAAAEPAPREQQQPSEWGEPFHPYFD